MANRSLGLIGVLRRGVSRWAGAIRIALVVAVLIFLFRFGIIQVDTLRAGMRSPLALLAAFLLVLCAVHISILRWWILLKLQGFRLSLVRVWYISYVGAFANSFLPGNIGGDVLRMYYAEREAAGAPGRALLTVVADRAFGLLGLLLAAGGAILASANVVSQSEPLRRLTASIGIFLLCSAIVLVALLFFGFQIRFRQWLRRFFARTNFASRAVHTMLDVASAYHRRWGWLVVCLILSILAQLFMAAGVVKVTQAMQLRELQPLDAAFAGLLSFLASVLPITPGGIGVGEGVFDQICRLLTPSAPELAFGTAFLVLRVISYCVVLPGALCYVFYHRLSGKPGMPQRPPQP
jgi:glycosyltransferase 2 family protein